jgi:Tol biopolymer transport system component
MIPPGTKLGIYTLDAPLGSGGMGEVYRARDQRLGRYVALKVLPDEFALDPSRRARFEQEARHVAALNHPNIIALYDIGEQNGVAYIVTELIDGTSLRDMKLSQRELLDVAGQIADGLAAAHAANITHRDVKPENVMVTREGRVKILDFGVATTGGLWGPDASTSAGTQTGVIVGTVGYMAPEQVRGEAVGPVADIFAFGVLLYELIAGSRAFVGDTAAEVMAAILKQDPPELPTNTPEGLRKIVERCLEKKPERRFQSAQDLAFALRHLAGTSVTAAAAPAAKVSGRQWRRIAALTMGFAVGVLLTGTLVNRWVSMDDAALDPVQLTRIAADRRNEFQPAISPDGHSVAYVRIGDGATELLVKPFDALAPISLVRSATALSNPVWIPDSNRVCYTGFLRDFLCVGAAGGTPQRLLPNAVSPQFTPNGKAVYFARAPDDKVWIFRSSPPGANPERVGDAPLPQDFTGLSSISPDGSRLVAISRSERWLVTLPDGAHRKLPVDGDVRTDSIGWFPDNRHIAVVEETTKLIGYRLVIQDTETAARRIVIRSGDPITAVSVSPDGTYLVYAGGLVERNIVEYSGEGKFVRGVATSSFLEGFASWAPQDDSFVYRMGGPGQTDSLWYSDAKNTAARPVQNLASNVTSQARISPDGTRIAFVQGGTAIQIVSTSGGRAVTVLQNPASRLNNVCWSPDSKWIWYSADRQLKKVTSEGGESIDIPAPPGALLDCSPDGRWLLRRGMTGFVITSTDGKTEREVARYDEYAARSDNSVQFGEGGKAAYALRVDRRTIDVVDVETGHKKRTITFDIPLEDQIDGFTFNSTGQRVLLTTGGERNDLWMVEGFAKPASIWHRWLSHWAAPSKVQ